MTSDEEEFLTFWIIFAIAFVALLFWIGDFVSDLYMTIKETGLKTMIEPLTNEVISLWEGQK